MYGRRLLVRRPSPRLAEGLLTHLDRQPIDHDLALRQWEAYCQTFVDEGWEVIEVLPADDCPDGVFIEDAAVVYGDLAVITRPGAPERRPETEGLDAILRDLGYRVARLTEPATLDGGDLLKHGHLIRIGVGGRTNRTAVAQMAELLEPMGARVIALPVSRTLHLKSQVTALPGGTVIGWPELVDDQQLYPDFLPVPEEGGAHVVLLDETTVLLAASAPQTAHLLRKRGLRVVPVDVSEYEKLEGCVTCLSVRLRG